jgi:hypothetical protein
MASLTPQPSLLRHRSFVLFWCARTSTSGAYQMRGIERLTGETGERVPDDALTAE